MTSPPIATSCKRSSESAASNAFAVWPSTGSGCSITTAASAVTPGDVVFGRLLARVGEDLRRFVELDQLAEIHEGGVVGNARGLLHVVSHDQHRDLVAQR